ncbi:alanine racemase [Endothiovibrio diazotrophicus]
MSYAARAVIDLGALRHNLSRVRAVAPDSRVLAVIKADGYGHGMLRVARALEGADGFAVGRMAEALALREAGTEQPVLLLEGVFDEEELRLAATHDLHCVVHTFEQIAMLEAASLPRPITAWMKIDSGMGRIGFSAETAEAAWRRLHACPAVAPVVHLCSHMARADEREGPYAAEQLACFEAVAARLDPPAGWRSLANSAGVFGHPRTHFDWVRPGISLYGISPFTEGHGGELGLRPVMTLSTRLIAIQQRQAGDAIGYGGGYRCPEAMPVGVAAIGYGDGYPRHATEGTPVRVNGVRVPLVGRVSMDMITLDVRGVPDARVGDEVVLWGEGLPVEEVAEHAGTIAYELLCGVTRRVVVEER